jgi:hypothetical protein
MPKHGPIQREVEVKSKQWTWNFLDVLREKQEAIELHTFREEVEFRIC